MGRGKSSVVWKFFKVVYFGADKRTRYTRDPKSFFSSLIKTRHTVSFIFWSCLYVDVTCVDQIWPTTMEQRPCINI